MCFNEVADTRLVADLRRVLDEVDEWFRTERPDLYSRLRPGLAMERIRGLEGSLAPYFLPEDLVVLYSWHDGWDAVAEGDYVRFLSDMPFNSLEEAVEQYISWCSLIPQMEPEVGIWHPLWFPAFLDQSGEFVELQPQGGQPAGRVFTFHSHDGWVSPRYDSVASLFETTLAAWRRGLLPLGGPFFPAGFQAFEATLNPETRKPDGRSRQEVSRAPSPDWPAHWLP